MAVKRGVAVIESPPGVRYRVECGSADGGTRPDGEVPGGCDVMVFYEIETADGGALTMGTSMGYLPPPYSTRTTTRDLPQPPASQLSRPADIVGGAVLGALLMFLFLWARR